MHIGFFNDSDMLKDSEKCPDCKSFYDINFTLGERQKWMKATVMKKKVMFIATNIGVMALDLNKILDKKEMPSAIYKHILDIPEAFRLTRFQDQLYILAGIPGESIGEDVWWENNDIQRKDLYEIF